MLLLWEKEPKQNLGGNFADREVHGMCRVAYTIFSSAEQNNSEALKKDF